jgi:hypothetical protein
MIEVHKGNPRPLESMLEWEGGQIRLKDLKERLGVEDQS